MADDVRTFLSRLPAASLADFLLLDEEDDEPPKTAELDLETILLEKLAEALPPGPKALGQHLPEAELFALNGVSLGDLLIADDTPLETLRDIKTRTKAMAAEAMFRPHAVVYTAIYYAAIAAALCSHRVRITSFTPDALLPAFESWARKSWMAPELEVLFGKACRIIAKPAST